MSIPKVPGREDDLPGIPVKDYLENLLKRKQSIHAINPPPRLFPYFLKYPDPSCFKDGNPNDKRPYPYNRSVWKQSAPVLRQSNKEQKKISPQKKDIATKDPPTKVPPEKIFVLLVSILYKGTVNELKGCVNDSVAIGKFWTDYVKVPPGNITWLTEETAGKKPTRSNILTAMYQMMQQSTAGSKLFIAYSGHGGDIRDTTGTEASGRTQVIFPLGFESDGVITDDEFYRLYNSALANKPQVSLFCFWDACHSGTFSDAPHQYLSNRNLTKIDYSYGSPQRESKAFVRAIAAATDSQTAADDQTPGQKPHGAGTDALLYTLSVHEKTPLSLQDFLLTMDKTLQKKGFSQRIQYTSTRKDSLETKFFF